MVEMVRCIVCKKPYNRDACPDFCPRCKNPLWEIIKEER